MVPDPSRTRPIVHIGAPKTATTWLQTTAFRRVIGRTLCGVTGPDATLNAAVRSMVVADLEGGPRYDADAVARTLATAGPLLVSDEGLAGLLWPRPRDRVVPAGRSLMADRLAAALPDAHVVLVTREPDTWLRSSYSTYVRHGGTRTFRRYVREVIDPSYCDWEALAALHRRRSAEVTVLRYEDLQADPQAFVTDLAARTGLRFADGSDVGVRNAGLSPWRRTALRTINRVRPSAIHPEPPAGIVIPGAARLAEAIGPR